MSVYQVDEYYIYITNLDISSGEKIEIEDLLEEEGYSNYEFQDNDSVLVVDDIQSEHEGEELEERILEIID